MSEHRPLASAHMREHAPAKGFLHNRPGTQELIKKGLGTSLQARAKTVELTSRSLIDALVSFAAEQRLRWDIPPDPNLAVDGEAFTLTATTKAGRTAIGQILLEENARSLEAALGWNEHQMAIAQAEVESYTATSYPAGLIGPAEVVAAAVDYEAQCKAAETWAMSFSSWIVGGIVFRAAVLMIKDGAEPTPARRRKR